MKNEVISNLSYLNKFLGYGNPLTAHVFFFAIEEHEDRNDKIIIDDFYKRKVENKRYYYLSCKPRSASGKTEIVQTSLSYRILTEKIRIQIPCSENDFLHGFETDYFTFYANIYPIGSKSNTDWSEANEIITGYDNKYLFRKDCFNGTGSFRNTISRKQVLSNFLKVLKRRMGSQELYIFIMGNDEKDNNSPGVVIRDIISDVYCVNCDCSGEGLIRTHLNSEVYGFYNNRIWITPHARNLSYIRYSEGSTEKLNDIDKILSYLI